MGKRVAADRDGWTHSSSSWRLIGEATADPGLERVVCVSLVDVGCVYEDCRGFVL